MARVPVVVGRAHWLTFDIECGTRSKLAMNEETPPSADVLGGLPREVADALFSKAREVVLKADHSLFTVGDRGDGCYRLEQGLLKASVRAANGNERILAIFGPGAVIGELAMIDGGARSASVAALRPFQAHFREQGDFRRLRQGKPGTLSAAHGVIGTASTRHKRSAHRDEFPVGQGASCKRAASACGRLRARRGQAVAAFWSGRKSARATLRPWRALRAKMSAGC
jgi:cyclic nucleotide-binding protein